MSDVLSCLESQGSHLIPLFLSPLSFFCLLLLLFWSCHFSADDPFSWLFPPENSTFLWLLLSSWEMIVGRWHVQLTGICLYAFIWFLFFYFLLFLSIPFFFSFLYFSLIWFWSVRQNGQQHQDVLALYAFLTRAILREPFKNVCLMFVYARFVLYV